MHSCTEIECLTFLETEMLHHSGMLGCPVRRQGMAGIASADMMSIGICMQGA